MTRKQALVIATEIVRIFPEFEEKEDGWGHYLKKFVCWNLRDE